MAPIPGTVRRGGGCGELLELDEEELEFLREEAAQATGEDDEDDEEKRKGTAVDVDVVRREGAGDEIADDDENENDLAATPPLPPPCIACKPLQRGVKVARCGLCVAEAGAGGNREAGERDEIIDGAKAAIDRREDEEKKGSRELVLLLLLLLLLLKALAAAAKDVETRRVSFLDDDREHIQERISKEGKRGKPEAKK